MKRTANAQSLSKQEENKKEKAVQTSPWATQVVTVTQDNPEGTSAAGLCRGPLFSSWQPQGAVYLLGYKDTSHDLEWL